MIKLFSSPGDVRVSLIELLVTEALILIHGILLCPECSFGVINNVLWTIYCRRSSCERWRHGDTLTTLHQQMAKNVIDMIVCTSACWESMSTTIARHSSITILAKERSRLRLSDYWALNYLRHGTITHCRARVCAYK